MAVSIIKYAFENGVINKEQYDKAEKYKKETGGNDEAVIKDMKLMSEEKLLKLYEQIYGYKAELEPDVCEMSLAVQFKKRDLWGVPIRIVKR